MGPSCSKQPSVRHTCLRNACRHAKLCQLTEWSNTQDRRMEVDE